MNKKSLFIIILIILAFISVMAIIYGYMNVEQSKENAEAKNQTYIELSSSSIDKCKEAAELLSDSTDYDTAIGYYAQNIEAAENPALKVYIAEAMVDYAINYFSTISINESVLNKTDMETSIYSKTIDELNSLKIQLSA